MPSIPLGSDWIPELRSETSRFFFPFLLFSILFGVGWHKALQVPQRYFVYWWPPSYTSVSSPPEQLVFERIGARFW